MSTDISKLDPRQKNMSKCSPVKRRRKNDAGNTAKKLKTGTSKGSEVELKSDCSVIEIKKVTKKTLKCVKSQKDQRQIEPKKNKTDRLKKDINCEASVRYGKRVQNADDLEKAKISEFLCKWKDEDYLADYENLPVEIAKNIIDLLIEENTLPFIARYRGHLTGELKPDKLRKVRETYEYIQKVHKEARKLHKKLLTEKVLTPELLSYIQTARSLEELDFVGSQFKKNNKRTLAERARQLGLQSPADLILAGKNVINLESLVNPEMDELSDVKKVRLGIQHIIADIISKTGEVHSELEKIYSSNLIKLSSKFKRQNEEAFSKYDQYGNFSQPLHIVKPHQVLAINRGESKNELSVKIIIPDSLWLPLKSFCKTKWLGTGIKYELRNSLFTDSVDDAIKRLLAPLAVRRLRAKLNAEAENEALCVFGYNLRQLLLTPPCTGNVVMGIDPGFKKGCKVAVVSHTGSLLGSDKFYLNDRVTSKKKLKSLISEFKCEIIALGNGTGCRETETLLSRFITDGAFKPLNVSYTIINEQGASVYSCSTIAAEEFPNLDPTIVGAISLARRLQNPLSELVKVEPKHLGVGMYQHDVSEKKLVSALDEIVSECVSFVGVDVNSASLYLLKRVAGLNTSKAQEIINYRSSVCSFKCREDLKKVKGIKGKTFQQCAGFLRVISSTASCIKHENCQKEFNPLDETGIHPESYETVYKIIKLFGLNLDEFGSEGFAEKIKNFEFTLPELAKYCDCSDLSVSFIVDTLKKPKNFDLRNLSLGPIFRREVKKLEDLFPGQTLNGIVRNTVSFGAFIDVGVGRDGLIHISQMRSNALQLNDRVNVEVVSVDKTTQRIQLKLISVVESQTL